MDNQTAQFDDLQLIALPTAVSCAEMFVRFTLAEWSLRDLVPVATSVSGALVQGAVDDADSTSPGMLTVRLRLAGGSLVVEVERDPSARRPQAAPSLDEGRTGVDSGRTGAPLVWCEVPLPGQQAASAVPLPKRERRPSAEAARWADQPDEVDPAVWDKLLTGLGGSSSGGKHAE